MIDSKAIVGTALTGDSALSALLGAGDRVFYWMPPSEPVYPCIVFREEDNAATEWADNAEYGSNIVVVIDVLSDGNTFAIADKVNLIMTDQGFAREYARDLFRDGVYQKHMRFSTTRRI